MTILAGKHSRTFAFSEAIADAIGSYEAAIVLQQIHYYIEQGSSGRVFNGVRWIYNSYRTWCKEFKLFKPGKVRQLINLLREFELVRVEQLTKNADDKNCFWYTINYERVDTLLSQDSRQNPSNLYSTGCVLENTAPVPENAGRVPSENSSIYIEFSSKKTPIDNNNPEAAVTCESEKEEEDLDLPEEGETLSFCLPPDPSQDETNEIEEVNDPHEGMNASSVRDNSNLYALCAYGFELTKQLEKIAAKYSEKEIERSLEYLEESKESGQVIQKPLGWLTECLKNEWWHDSFKSREEAAVIEGLAKQGKFLNTPELFFAEFWQMVDEGFINLMPTDQWEMEGLLGSYLQFLDETLYVNWYDPDFQSKLDQGIFQTMPLTHARKLFYEER